MNERIGKLVEQAKAYSDQQWLEAGYPNWEIYSKYYTKDYNEKFAELIVTKCAVIATRCESNGTKNIGAEILEHFGVEDE